MLNKSRNNLYLCLVNIKNKIEEVKNEQLDSIENKRINNVKDAKTTDEFEFIELCAKTEKEDIINDFNSQIILTYKKKNTK